MLIFVVVVISCAIISVCQSDPALPVHQSGQDNPINQHDSSLSQREPRLEDFFWSGSGDGPPDYLKKVHTAAKNGKEVIIKTETIVATVYVGGSNEEDAICLDCVSGINGIPLNYTTDRRYWLLTVVAGFFRPRDFPMLEGHLAKLYRIAFTRQQSFHLGISTNLTEHRNNTIRSKRYTKDDDELQSKEDYRNRRFKRIIKRSLPPDIEIDPVSESNENRETDKEKAQMSQTSRLPNNDHDIKILIHNVTLITEDDIQNWESNYDDVNDQRNLRPLANQTEIIYSVFVDGKPILATTAAEDMKLVSENEVTSIMEKDIYMKAEPYLKEPQATPLVPAGKNGTLNIYNVFTHNPVMIAVTSFTILLLILLLVALLLMTRAKRQRSAEVKRLSSRQGLLSSREVMDPPTNRTGMDATDSRTNLEDGVENHGFVYDQSITKRHESNNRDYPTIDFPLPPVSRPSSTSTTSTSDSSVYCPVNKPNQDLQNMLDEKANRLFDKKKKGSRSELREKNEQIYSAIGKKRKHKLKRKYLSENRVGSIEETVQIHSSQTSISTDSISESLKPDYNQFEHNEAYNPNTNYHRNKILENRVFSDKVYDTVGNPSTSPTQAINREIIKVLQHGEKSSDCGSIGSFLSMASVKSFPRHQLPEPLHRVLEPVSVTHYDYYDQSGPIGVIKKPRNSKTVTLVDAPKRMSAVQSDNPDPGVIGPIVWEIHKKRLANQNESPARDPASTRDRFEGLLEGAIQLYTTTGTSPQHTAKKFSTKSTGVGNVRLKDNRGKSAINPSRLSRSNSEVRPVTAGPTKSHSNNSTQPPSPNGRAWGSGAPSPLVRPLSAGPFHRPEAPSVDITRVLAHQSNDRTQLSAAPLIEAIQNELKKFKRESNK